MVLSVHLMQNMLLVIHSVGWSTTVLGVNRFIGCFQRFPTNFYCWIPLSLKHCYCPSILSTWCGTRGTLCLHNSCSTMQRNQKGKKPKSQTQQKSKAKKPRSQSHPSIHPSFLHVLPPSFLPSIHSSFLSFFLPSFTSFLHVLPPSLPPPFHPFFLPSFLCALTAFLPGLLPSLFLDYSPNRLSTLKGFLR